MGIALIIVGGLIFLGSAAAHLYVRIKLKPADPELDEWYYEFEDQHPEVVRYNKWTQMTFMGICAGMLLLFLGLVF